MLVITQSRLLTTLTKKALENSVGKGENAGNHTIPTFNHPNEEGFGKQCGKRRKCW